MMKLIQKMMISCKVAADLIHKKHNIGLSRREKVSLRVHNSMCSICKTFEKQIDQIDSAIEEKFEQTQTPDTTQLKQDIKTKLDSL
jgi:hypothetical protein